MNFHHFGLATSNFHYSKEALELLGYSFVSPLYDPIQKVNLTIGTKESHPAVEIIFPSSEKGPIDSIIKMSDPNIYHICYEVDSISDSVESMKRSGLRLKQVTKEVPAVLFDNRMVSFYYCKGLGLIEFLQKT